MKGDKGFTVLSAEAMHEAWKQTEAAREVRAYGQAIRNHDLRLIEQEEVKAKEQEEEEAIKARRRALMKAYDLSHAEVGELDQFLTVAIRGLGLLSLIIGGYIIYLVI